MAVDSEVAIAGGILMLSVLSLLCHSSVKLLQPSISFLSPGKKYRNSSITTDGYTKEAHLWKDYWAYTESTLIEKNLGNGCSYKAIIFSKIQYSLSSYCFQKLGVN